MCGIVLATHKVYENCIYFSLIYHKAFTLFNYYVIIKREECVFDFIARFLEPVHTKMCVFYMRTGFLYQQEVFMAKILIVDDEVNIRKVVREYAEFEGYEVEEAENGMDAVNMCKENDFDLIIMDVMMPRLDGYSACKEIHKSKSIPVIMLSARGEEYDKLFGFEIGVDDYVVKPFSPKELMARVKAVLKRGMGKAETTGEKLTFEGLEIDMSGREVYVNGKKASMTPKEYDLLFYLVKNKNIALSRDKLLEEVWGYDFFGDDRTVDTHIKMLRNSLGEYRKFIVTLRGMGYKFEAV